MVAAKDKLATYSGSSVFYRVLETEGISAAEEVADRNFRDMVYPIVPATYYVHSIFYVSNTVSHPGRFLINNNLWYLPEAGNAIEEKMLGVFPQHFYHPENTELFSNQELVNGKHLRLNKYYIIHKYFSHSADDNYFTRFCKTLQKRK